MSDTPFTGDPPLTPAQRAAIVRDEHTLIAAGAGSGKTTTLVDKILYALGAERVPGSAPRRRCELHDIAAITFTNAAAADFKRKLRKRIRDVADWHAREGHAAEAAIWRERVYEVDRARIGTIHSFCGDILREFALRIGMDPGFMVLDEAEASLLRDECLAAVLDKALATRASAMSLVEHLGLARTSDIIDQLASCPDLLKEVESSWFEDGAMKIAQLRTMVMDGRQHWGCDEDEGVWRPEFDELSAALCTELFELARQARAMMVARLDEQSAVDFDEMILRTREVLSRDATILGAVRAKLAWLFIDEFQDTDRAQLEIAYLISGFEAYGTRAPSPDDAGCRLCIVGDPKQSIYRFRRADVSLWARTRHDFASRGIEAIELDTNFRSLAPIVGFVNATFSGLIGHSPEPVLECGHDIAYGRLLPHRRADVDASAVELLVVEPEGKKVGDVRAAEAEQVVARMFEIVNGDDVVWDDKARVFRRATWRDIAVLVRARTPLPAFEAAFRKHGVPYYMSSGDGFFERREIVDVRLLLAALSDRHDDVSWLGVLRSPWIGLSDEAILRARIGLPRAPISALLDGSCVERDEPIFQRARTLTGRLGSMRDRVTVAELMDYALSASGYGAYVLTRPDGELAAMNLRKLVQVADGRRGDTVSDFLQFMKTRAESAREADALLFTADEDVVTVTTIHSAKGLEWPVVFLVDLDKDIARNEGAAIYADADAGAAVRHKQEQSVAGTWEYLKKRDEQLTMAEEKRLWYVATTRARDRLILCGRRDDVARAAAFRDPTAEGEPESVKDWLFQALVERDGSPGYSDEGALYAVAESRPGAHLPVVVPEAPLPSDVQVAAARDTLASTLASRVARIPLTRSLPRYSATQLKTFDDDPNRYERVYVYGLADRRVFSRQGGDAPKGVPARILGDVLHGALEIDREEEDLLLYIEAQLSSRLGEEASSPRVQAATTRLRKLVEQSRTHPAVARLYDALGAERELAFTWFLRDGTTTSVMSGAMDLVAVVDGTPEILDFKSHRLKHGAEETAASEYRVQLQAYSAAFAALTGTVPGKFTFFFPETATPVERLIDAQTIAAADANVRALIARMAEGAR